MLFRAQTAAKIGSVSYVIWGILHFNAAYEVYKLGATQAASMVQGRLYQDAWNLAFFAVVATFVALRFNWRNDQTGFWINLLTVSVTDLGFLIFVLIPGHSPVFPGIVGPIFWVLGAIFTSWARFSREPRSV